MFFKERNQNSKEDIELERLGRKVLASKGFLCDSFYELVVLKNIIDLYPEKSKLDETKKTFINKQKEFKEDIQVYEQNRLKYIQYWEDTKDKRITTSKWLKDMFSESHVIIELDYLNRLLFHKPWTIKLK